MTAPGEAGVPADAPAFGDLCFPANGQHKVGLVLRVPHVIGVGRIPHVTVTELRLRSRKRVAYTGPDGVIAAGKIPLEFYPGSHTKVIVVLAYFKEVR